MKKFIHLQQAKHARKKAHIMSVLLPNGNLVVPKIMSRKPFVSCWVEVVPGTSDYKKWYNMREEDHPDPRTLQGYIDQQKDHDPEGKFAHTHKGVYNPK